MQYVSAGLFIVGSILFVLGIINVGEIGATGTMSHSSYVQNAIALYVAAIAAELIWGRRQSDR